MSMIPLFKVNMAPEASAAVAEVLASGYIGQGAKVEQFERTLTTQFGAPILTVNSCTSAIDLAMHMTGVGPGTEVITTAQTCTASNSPAVNRGATLVWADVNPITGLIDPASVAKLITPKTRAIIAVDWSGQPCDYDALRSFGIPVVEDAAHAFFATYKGQSIAKSGGHFVCWSFQAIKHLTTGDGGAIKVPADQFDRARLLRWYGLDRRGGESFRCAQNIQEIGYKYHMNDIAATIGIANFDVAIGGVFRSVSCALAYNEAFRGLQGVTVPDYHPKDCSHWLYTILVENRDSFVGHMASRGIATSQVHARNDRHDAFRTASVARTPLPGLDHFSAHQIAIPCGWWVSDEDLEYIINGVRSWSNTL